MKNLNLLAAILVISLGAYAGNITETYYFNSPAIQTTGNFQSVSFEGTFMTGRTGEPVLPYQSVQLLLPPGEEAIKVSIRFEDETTVDGRFVLYPQQPVRPLSQGCSGIFQMNKAVYHSNDNYPKESLGKYSTYFMNGHSILLSSFTPVKYSPNEGMLSYFRKVTVEVVTGKTGRAMEALNNLGTKETGKDRHYRYT